MYDAVTIEKNTVNGIAVDALNETIEAIKTDAGIAQFKFRARNRWVGGTHNRTTINSLYGAHQEIERAADFMLDKDEPEILLGTDLGPNPVEYALAALAGCLTTTLVCFAAVEGVAIDEIESEIEGDTDLRGFLGLDSAVRRGLSEIRVSFKIKSDAPPEKMRELIETAKSRSGVFDMLNNGVPISIKLNA
jgi:uncharacterized OsmC-like protein